MSQKQCPMCQVLAGDPTVVPCEVARAPLRAACLLRIARSMSAACLVYVAVCTVNRD